MNINILDKNTNTNWIHSQGLQPKNTTSPKRKNLSTKTEKDLLMRSRTQ